MAEQLIDVVSETITELSNFTQAVLQKIDHWSANFVIGKTTGDGDTDYSSVYSSIKKEIYKIQNKLDMELQQGNSIFPRDKNYTVSCKSFDHKLYKMGTKTINVGKGILYQRRIEMMKIYVQFLVH